VCGFWAGIGSGGFGEDGVICSWDESLVVKGRWWDIRFKSEYLGCRVLKALLIADTLYLFITALRLSLGFLLLVLSLCSLLELSYEVQHRTQTIPRVQIAHQNQQTVKPVTVSINSTSGRPWEICRSSAKNLSIRPDL